MDGPAADRLRDLEQRLRPDFRRPVVFGVLALVALIAGHGLGGLSAHALHERIAVLGCAGAVALFGTWSARTTATEVARLTRARAGAGPAATLRIGVMLAGMLIAVIAVLDLLAVPVHYLVGGTVIALILGVAAQQVLGNLVAGLVLLFARPYRPGEYIRIRSGTLGGPHDGTVTGVGLLYTTIAGPDGVVNVPNSAMLGAAVGPVPRPDLAPLPDAVGPSTGTAGADPDQTVLLRPVTADS